MTKTLGREALRIADICSWCVMGATGLLLSTGFIVPVADFPVWVRLVLGGGFDIGVRLGLTIYSVGAMWRFHAWLNRTPG